MDKATKWRVEPHKTKVAITPRLPSAGLDKIIEKYQKLGGQERRVKPVFIAHTPKSDLKALVKNYTKRMYSRGVLTGNPTGIVKTTDIPKQEFVPVDSSCVAEEKKESPGGYNKIIENLERRESEKKKDEAA